MGAELRHLVLYEFLFLFGDAELNAVLVLFGLP